MKHKPCVRDLPFGAFILRSAFAVRRLHTLLGQLVVDLARITEASVDAALRFFSTAGVGLVFSAGVRTSFVVAVLHLPRWSAMLICKGGGREGLGGKNAEEHCDHYNED